MYGQGLLKGLSISIKHFFSKKVTQMYPEEKPVLPKRFRGWFELTPEKCTACGLCVNACPNRIISIESYKDENNKRKLSKYRMLMESCIYCGFCVEACPQDALYNTQDFEKACFFRQDLDRILYQIEPPAVQAGGSEE
ncbi:NADH-quinone oxidoreductase subunit I [Dehalobacter sp. DCM]|uniref:NuoI/complex I 23 kDa subunit family protein n=1 Tax=Dehalobacter sp. DCM TaxID=2907827 RepID=UPI003081F8AE|nr:NADH-quinone oxidoreductase subunit I [Dehalobacter sp. DCM]